MLEFSKPNEYSSSTVDDASLNPMSSSSRIAIVEDNVDMQQFVSDLFSPHYKVFTASNGVEGLALLEEHSIDLVISDVMMPELNGFDMLSRLRADQRFERLPVIMLTSLKEEVHLLKALSIGVDEYLTKPFSPNELKARVSNMLTRSQARMKERDEIVSSHMEKMENWRKEDISTFIKKVEEIVVSEFENEEFKIEELASHFNLGERHFRRKMKLITGLSPKNFQREVAMQKARELLENRQYNNLSAVAYSVGIRNTTRFAALYEARFGTDPRTYFRF